MRASPTRIEPGLFDTAPASARARRKRLVLAALVGLACGLFTLRFGLPPASWQLDRSWITVLAWAYQNGLQWGPDVVFTYGPYAFTHHSAAYWAPLFGAFWSAQLVTGLAFALLTARLVAMLEGRGAAACAIVLLLSLPWLGGEPIRYLVPGLLLAAYSSFTAPRGLPLQALGVLLGAALVALLALTKATQLPLLPLWYACGFLALRDARLRAAHAVALPVALLTMWLGAGQQPATMPAFLDSVWSISAGYGPAMSLEPERAYFDALAVLVTIATGAWLTHALVRALRAREWGPAAVALFAGACLFVDWRASFTRADTPHITDLFPTAAVLAWIALAAAPRAATRDARSCGAVALLAVVCGWFVSPDAVAEYRAMPSAVGGAVFGTLRPDLLRAQHEAELARRRVEHDLPAVRAAIRDEPVDLMMYSQGILFLNGFRYAPRPVFQSYSAYDERLARRNEAFLLGESAPRFVLFELQALDYRWPASEDALALVALARRYTPILAERSFVLFERRAVAAAPVSREGVAVVTRPLGEWIPLAPADTPTLLFVDVEPSVAGRIRGLLLREAALLIEARLDDGTVWKHRLPRNVGHAGFLVSPYVSTTESFAELVATKRGRRVAAFRLLPAREGDARYFEPDFRAGTRPLE